MSANQFHFSYGYVLFKKRRDAASKRGWVQESYVVVSELNLIGFFYKLLDDLSQGWPFEEVFRQSVEEWPWPTPGTQVTVKLL